MFEDPEFQLRYADRWHELRRDRSARRTCSGTSTYAALLDEAQQRNSSAGRSSAIRLAQLVHRRDLPGRNQLDEAVAGGPARVDDGSSPASGLQSPRRTGADEFGLTMSARRG